MPTHTLVDTTALWIPVVVPQDMFQYYPQCRRQNPYQEKSGFPDLGRERKEGRALALFHAAPVSSKILVRQLARRTVQVFLDRLGVCSWAGDRERG